MSQHDLPGEGTVNDTAAPSYEDSVNAISELIDDPGTDLRDEAQDHEEAEGEEIEAEASMEADGDDPEGHSEDAEDGDAPADIKGGQFAPDSAKVKLDDGRVVSIAELKRGTLFQADYTRKTTALAEERKRFEQQKALADQYAQSLQTEREFLLQAAQTFLPQPPDRSMMDTDPIGYMQAKAAYDERMAVAQQLQQQMLMARQRQQHETQAQREQRKRAEAERLFEAMPDLRSRETYARFWSDTVEVMADYGFTPEELNEADDHRFYKVFRDLIRLKKAVKNAPKVKDEVQRKPLLSQQKRMAPQAKNSREKQKANERLRQTGSFEAGVAALMTLDDL